MLPESRANPRNVWERTAHAEEILKYTHRYLLLNHFLKHTFFLRLLFNLKLLFVCFCLFIFFGDVLYYFLYHLMVLNFKYCLNASDSCYF